MKDKIVNFLVAALFTFLGLLSAIGMVNIAKKATEGQVSGQIACLAIFALGFFALICAGGAFTFLSWMLGYPRRKIKKG